MKKKQLVWIFVLLGGLLLSACGAGETDGASLSASGTISAVQVAVAPEQGGKVTEVLVEEGQQVQAGDALFRLDNEYLLAQQRQAQAAVEVAQAALQAAQIQHDVAQLQYEQVQQAARMQSSPLRVLGWQADQPDVFERPSWYFGADEEITAARSAVDSAREKLEAEQADLEDVLQDASNQDFLDVERRLAAAQAVYQAAQSTLTQAQDATGDKQELVDAAQKNLDSAEADLEAVSLEYDRMLTTSSADSVLEARARVAVAQATLDNSEDSYDALLVGDNSLQVQTAEAGVRQAEAAVSQAQAGLKQAQAALDILNLGLERTEVTAPSDGTVLSVNLEAGEVVGAGSVVVMLAELGQVTLTVYIPEDLYGQVELGQQVDVEVDAFPDKVYTGEVTYISDQAEFTPRNVQTEESRTSTVYAVKISLDNPYGELKPGMPADAAFQ